MSNLNKYIEKIEQYIKENPNLSEELLIRYVYLDLAQRFSFNPQFKPFGNSKSRREIYYRSGYIEELENCMESNLVICKSAARILEYVLKHFGVNIKTVVEEDDTRRCPHVYNTIIPKNGSESYNVDLQEDMYRVQMHGFTTNYGTSTKDENILVISRFEQEQMDRKLGYIDSEHYYSDDYLYLLKSDVGYFENFEDKAKFIIENIEGFENPKMQYIDRQWYHVRILQNFFSRKEFNYDDNTGKIYIIDCYKKTDGENKYVNCVVIRTANETCIYVYNNKEGKYFPINITNFAKAVKNGLVIHNCKVPGLGNALKRIKTDDNSEEKERN